MKILVATSEAVPFAKTGGLADVCGALPLELARLGHRPSLILPAYRQTQYCGIPIESLGIDFIVPVGSKTVTGHLLGGVLPGSDVPVYLVQKDDYFDRDGLYSDDDNNDFIDNCERYVFFSRAVLETIRLLNMDVDVVHVNDWQTALIPAYLKLQYNRLPQYRNIASLFTIHNMSYQGQFWHWDMLLTGLDWKHFNWHEMEFYGKLNLLKTGLVYSDSINTVSPQYSREIQNAKFGCGLEGILRYRSEVLSGILNGIDENEWNPATDTYIAANYDVDSVDRGKPVCKAALQKEFGLPEAADVPLLGMVGRLVDQKGCDLVAEVLVEWAEKEDAQWVILGTGDPKYHDLFEELAQRYPEKIAVRLEFANGLAHLIEAGADMFLMPSRYEPCGLNQMYSLKYGTVPVVRETGGLADTIADANKKRLAEGTANGFSFREDSAVALDETLRRACRLYAEPDAWSALVSTGMRQDWSWTRSAEQYIALYEQTIERRKRATTSDA